MSFTTPSYDLIDLFNRIDRGDIQLPDFQRDYSWDVDRIRGLIISVLRGYPIGCLMALDVRNTTSRFRPRPLSGAPDTGVEPGLLLLDGQQRLTTLYHSLCGDGIVDTVDFRDKKIQRKFYIDVERAVSRSVLPDEAVYTVDPEGTMTSHYGPNLGEKITGREQALAHGAIAISDLLSDIGTDLLFDIADGRDDVFTERVKRFNNTVLKPLVRYQVPMIRLDRETSQGGIGSIFAQANNAGLQMDIFDLLTAVFAQEDPSFHLQSYWDRVEADLRAWRCLDRVGRTEWLTAVTLYSTARKKGRASGVREDILRLDLDTYLESAVRVLEGFNKAAKFLEERKMFKAKLVPFTSQIVPLAVILALLEDADPEILTKTGPADRLNRWFWSSIFGELYGSAAIISRAGRDVDQVTEWVLDAARTDDEEAAAETAEDAADDTDDPIVYSEPTTMRGKRATTVRPGGVPEPQTVACSKFSESRLLSVRKDDGVFQGIYALLLGRGAMDWRTPLPVDQETFRDQEIGIHRIFPKVWCRDHGIDEVLMNSIVNRTPMALKTDILIGETGPDRYMPRVQSKSMLDDEEFDQVLEAHVLDPQLLFKGDGVAFLTDRRRRLLKMVEIAMGKPAVHDVDDANLCAGDEGPNAFKPEEKKKSKHTS